MGALREKLILMTVWIEGERKQRNTGRMKGCSGPLWCGSRRSGSQRQPGPASGFPMPEVARFPLATSSSCKIKKSLERWQLGQPTESPRGGVASESCHLAFSQPCLVSPSPLQKVNNAATLAKSPLSVSHSISFLIFLFHLWSQRAYLTLLIY